MREVHEMLAGVTAEEVAETVRILTPKKAPPAPASGKAAQEAAAPA